MDALIDFVLSPSYAAMGRNLAIISVVFAVAATVFAFAHYGRGREAGNSGDQPWVLLIGTLRDSFVLTLLYAADALVAQSSGLQSFGAESDPFKVVMSIAATFSGPVFQILIIAVAVLRVHALSRWMKDQGK